MRLPSRRIAIAVFCAVAIVSFGGTAHADPAGPTDYLSEIQAIEPPTASIDVAVIGGDSFIQLTVEPGTEVLVVGYRGEDYLWFQPDGTVLENRNAPTTYQNEERYGTDFPANASADAPPEWEQIGSDGRWAWHDHRAHWMQTIRPAGKGPGDQVVENVIPLVVDGETVDVTVISTWQPPASKLPIIAGVAVGLSAAIAGVIAWRRRSPWTAVTIPLIVLAFVVGWWQYISLPAETGPRLVWWVLPTIAAIAGIIAVVAETRRARFLATAAALIAAIQLVIWGAIKRDGLTAALIPTDAPGWLDRLATAAALVGGIAIAILALWDLFGPRRPAAVAQTTQPAD